MQQRDTTNFVWLKEKGQIFLNSNFGRVLNFIFLVIARSMKFMLRRFGTLYSFNINLWCN
jgi:hypothetical protein